MQDVTGSPVNTAVLTILREASCRATNTTDPSAIASLANEVGVTDICNVTHFSENVTDGKAGGYVPRPKPYANSVGNHYSSSVFAQMALLSLSPSRASPTALLR